MFQKRGCLLFGVGIAEGVTLVSKLENSEAYSQLMTDIAGSTVPYAENLQAITQFAAGKGRLN